MLSLQTIYGGIQGTTESGGDRKTRDFKNMVGVGGWGRCNKKTMQDHEILCPRLPSVSVMVSDARSSVAGSVCPTSLSQRQHQQ